MPDRPTTRKPEPGGVVLPPWAVEGLRARLARSSDPNATAEERADARIELCGYLGGLLDGEL